MKFGFYSHEKIKLQISKQGVYFFIAAQFQRQVNLENSKQKILQNITRQFITI